MSCLGECWDLGPPPDTILFMPPPPVPSFFDQRLRDNLSSLPCGGGGAQLCGGVPSEWEPPKSERGDIPTLSAQDITTADDTWPLVLVAASVGVLVLGALLALFLLRCREQQSSKEHQQPHHPQHRIGGKASAASIAAAASSVPNGENTGDSRAVCWAALTPRGGTQHFVSVDDEENHHYETVDGPWYRTNCGNYEYEEPALLTSPIPAWLQPQLQQQDMRCISTLRRPRPRVSPPTRIEHPNLPPLNLNPLPGPPPPPPPRRPSTMGTLSRRQSDANTLLKYNMN